MKKGLLISLEGPDGSGKSSVLEALSSFFQQAQEEVLTTREPGGVPIAEGLRRIILDPQNTAMDEKTELLLYIASRRQHLAERVLPALAEGKTVIMDRFIDSSVAYQGYGRGLEVEEINWLNHYATDGLKPDLTIYLDIDVKEGLERIAKSEHREADRLDQESLDWHERVRQGYLKILAQEPERFVKIDASQALEQVIEDSLRVIQERFG